MASAPHRFRDAPAASAELEEDAAVAAARGPHRRTQFLAQTAPASGSSSSRRLSLAAGRRGSARWIRFVSMKLLLRLISSARRRDVLVPLLPLTRLVV